ncbi:D-alanyl-D-alanine carboxypeptidase (penicillin-binding protein 5/6) [Aliiroseovarius halocynthiae]|uniref:serine-type D-Ala-D-Ala carboxypeptidase n=1 Tax=Aliiroseovarius halocynthiae TaxID=985055 RepID=A0A545SUT1_9RHOB|nr:D-alanyl-D-alanine carboxypeptidase family protein [Aliiroseovarius halocynthiae]TQV68717.1 D-alanyl-D-alanine carboxypeptidase [Aliiroseovarius halocynthiae]SMR71138.1 D-alanyl-D-alanine carboxypeptidase (penicillin-binding protein 5/6) [Aliiroseovarius halocynthiae]
MLHRLTLCISALIALFFVAALPARAFDTRATSAYVLDVTTGTVLLEKNAEVPLPPASMSKLMTVNMLFEALADGRVTLSTPFGVSDRAANMGGSTMFLTQGDRPTVEDLIQGIIVQSGNDACVAVAEGLAGTEEAFARMMTDRASALGLRQSTFANASGWPHPMQRMSMKDLALLARHLIVDFPDYYRYFAQTEYHYKDRAPDNRFNRNPLLRLGIGADGLKTGHTQEAGYGLVGSARQGDRRIVFVISGMGSEKERAEEAEAIVNWAFRQFTMKTTVKAGQRVAEAPVWLGSSETVGLVPAEDVNLLIPAGQRDGISATINWTGPIPAPIAQGQELAQMVISRDGLSDTVIPLYAERGVGNAGYTTRLTTAATKLLAHLMGNDAPPLPVEPGATTATN